MSNSLVRSEFIGGEYEESRLLGYKNPICTSQETHYVSTIEPSRLMLLGETVAVYCENRTEYTDTVRTSQETHRYTVYVQNTNSEGGWGWYVQLPLRGARSSYQAAWPVLLLHCLHSDRTVAQGAAVALCLGPRSHS
jgi:hypothetical protein